MKKSEYNAAKPNTKSEDEPKSKAPCYMPTKTPILLDDHTPKES